LPDGKTVAFKNKNELLEKGWFMIKINNNTFYDKPCDLFTLFKLKKGLKTTTKAWKKRSHYSNIKFESGRGLEIYNYKLTHPELRKNLIENPKGQYRHIENETSKNLKSDSEDDMSCLEFPVYFRNKHDNNILNDCFYYDLYQNIYQRNQIVKLHNNFMNFKMVK
jgi:hypothetical protein